jgi:hypothetical protein
MNWLTLTHTQRWHQHRNSVGNGHVYQGRFKSFPVETSDYLLTVCRYVERNPVRAGLVKRAEQWQWSSAASSKSAGLHQWPIPRPQGWAEWVNAEEHLEEVEALRRSVLKGQPFGSESWVQQSVTRWKLGMTLRERGRPPKNLGNNGSLYLSFSRRMIPAMMNWSMIDRWFHGPETGCQRGSSCSFTCRARTVARVMEPAFRKAGRARRMS